MKLVLGTVQFGLNYGINNSKGQPSLENSFAILDKAATLGIGELDTADAYGNSTAVLAGYFSKNPDKKFKLMSKFVGDGETSFRNAFEKSCKNLGVNSLDGYYFHRFSDFKNFHDYKIVHELKAEGKLKNLAVSLYSSEELELAVHSKEVDLIQLPFNIFDRSDKKIELLNKAKAAHKLIYVRSAFLQGLFYKDVNFLPEKLKPLRPALVQLHTLIETYKVSIEELCLGFLNEQKFIDKIIIGVDSVEQLESNAKSLTKVLPHGLVQDVLKIKIDFPELLIPVNWGN